VALWANAHLMMHIPNAIIMEIVRGYVDGWYNDIVTDQIKIEDGYLFLNGKPGLGTALRDEVWPIPDARWKYPPKSNIKSGKEPCFMSKFKVRYSGDYLDETVRWSERTLA